MVVGELVDKQESSDDLETEAVEMLRIPRSLIDGILNMMGETSVSLGQMLEKLQALSENGVQMQSQDKVLQARRFELEDLINIQGLANQDTRLKLVNGDDELSDFDSLELDEYNELYGATHGYIEAVADTRVISQAISEDVGELETLFVQQQRLNRALQDMVMDTRMVTVSTITARLQRAVRQAARMTGKDVELEIIGEDLNIDGDVLAKLTDPLMHLLRNAVDHGIEDEEQRFEKGKDVQGLVTLNFAQTGNHIIVSCSDDGVGLDYERIKSKAIEKGLIENQDIDDQAIARLILQPGFTTRDDATQVSGRGVGMDVVNDAVIKLKGNLHIDRNAVAGTLIEMRIPITLLTNHSVLITAGGEQFAIPTNTLEQIFTPGAGQLERIGENLSFSIDRNAYPIEDFSALVGLTVDELKVDGEPFRRPVLLLRVDNQLTAVVVDSVESTLELVVKGCGKYVGEVSGVAGLSLLGNGQVLPVMDIPQLIRGQSGAVELSRAPEAQLRPGLSKILVVDDSLSARNSLAELANDAGYSTLLARDGLEALKLLRTEAPDLVLTDLEMPRMNGLELTSNIRSNSEMSHLPIVMVTSRTMQKHKEEALAAGVNAYVAKPFIPEDLLSLVSQHIEGGSS